MVGMTGGIPLGLSDVYAGTACKLRVEICQRKTGLELTKRVILTEGNNYECHS
jgi:hypothetical protein